MGEPNLEGDDRFLVCLPDVDEVEYVGQGINCPRWVEMLINIGDHLETFTIKATFFHKEI